jgi:hypothetical protein
MLHDSSSSCSGETGWVAKESEDLLEYTTGDPFCMNVPHRVGGGNRVGVEKRVGGVGCRVGGGNCIGVDNRFGGVGDRIGGENCVGSESRGGGGYAVIGVGRCIVVFVIYCGGED